MEGGREMSETQKDRRERVRKLLVEPLQAQGMRKPRSRAAEDHQDFLDRLERRLAYLGADHLEALAEVVLRNAEGASRNVWPAEASIVNWAAVLEPPPDRDSRLVQSYLASAAGQRAWDEAPSVAVALRRHLRKAGRPPQEFDWIAIRRQAETWESEMARIREQVAEGSASSEQRERLDAWERMQDRVRSLVFSQESAA